MANILSTKLAIFYEIVPNKLKCFFLEVGTLYAANISARLQMLNKTSVQVSDHPSRKCSKPDSVEQHRSQNMIFKLSS